MQLFSILPGGFVIVATILGQLCSGVFMHKLNLKMKASIKLNMALTFVVLICSPGLMLKCGQDKIAGVTRDFQG